MQPASIQKLQDLSTVVEGLICRDDIPLASYEMLYSNQLETHKLIEINPKAYSSQEEYDRAWWLSNYIIISLLITINSIHELRSSR